MRHQSEVYVSTEAPWSSPRSAVLPVIACSFELKEVASVLLADLPGVVDVRLLAGPKPKLFVVTRGKDLDRDYRIAQRLVQVEDVKPATFLHYDVVPEDKAHLIPSDAASVR